MQSLIHKQNQIDAILNEMNQPKLMILSRFLRERIQNPQSFVVMLGETSSGKSSLINGLLGETVLAAAAGPTTGTVTEILEDMELKSLDYYAVNTDATLERIDFATFKELEKMPDEQLQRLRVKVPQFPNALRGLRLFDTPGYNSIVSTHEEVLKEFIPESDVIIYTINYRVGMQQNDNDFLSFVQELVGQEIPILVVINRCPEGTKNDDKRVKEIIQHIEDCLHHKVEYFLVPAVAVEPGKTAMPEANSLWNRVAALVNSEERTKAIYETLASYQEELIQDIKNSLEKQILSTSISNEEKARMLELKKENLKRKRELLQIMETDYNLLEKKMTTYFSMSSKVIKKKLAEQINTTNKWTSEDECTGFVKAHLMPLEVKKQTKEISYQLQRELEAIDDKINNYLETAFNSIEKEVALKLPRFEKYANNLMNKILQKSVGVGLGKFFAQYGGRGGTGAGVANAAKKALKKFGDLIGKKFSRETYNNLAHFLKKIGATSSKAVSSAATVIVEGLFYIIGALSWQGKLVKLVEESIDKWHDETLEGVCKDLRIMKDENFKLVTEIFDSIVEGFTIEEEENKEEVQIRQLLKSLTYLEGEK